MARESDIEQYLHTRVKALGGDYRRVSWIGRNHGPDDLILLPGRSFYVECKRPGEKPRPGQAREHDRLRASGITVHVFSTPAEIDTVLPIPTNP
jgi:hypothetical protein